MFEYFTVNKLISLKQPGFKPSDSYINPLSSFTNLQVTWQVLTFAVLLDKSKAFDKVWHNGLIFKINQYGISRNLFRLAKRFLKNCKLRILQNGQASSWANLLVDIPQWSILGPFFLDIYQWSIRRFIFKFYIICWQYISFYSWMWRKSHTQRPQ